jgi:hypothetical protein
MWRQKRVCEVLVAADRGQSRLPLAAGQNGNHQSESDIAAGQILVDFLYILKGARSAPRAARCVIPHEATRLGGRG